MKMHFAIAMWRAKRVKLYMSSRVFTYLLARGEGDLFIMKFSPDV